jgi:hypothetical protein
MASTRGSGGFIILVDTISLGIERLNNNIQDVEDQLLDVVTNMVQDARDNAPWQDETGDARAGLDASIDESQGVYTVTLYHSVDYGQWLETIQSGEYAIIMPTIEKYAAEIEKTIGTILMGGHG